MGYQLWAWTPAKPSKRDVKYNKGTVIYIAGVEGSNEMDLRYVRKMEKLLTANDDKIVILGAAVNGKLVTNNDYEFMKTRAYIKDYP